MATDDEVLRQAERLEKIADDLRSAGDVPLVLIDDEGVAPAAITLADELWLVAFALKQAAGTGPTTEADDATHD